MSDDQTTDTPAQATPADVVPADDGELAVSVTEFDMRVGEIDDRMDELEKGQAEIKAGQDEILGLLRANAPATAAAPEMPVGPPQLAEGWMRFRSIAKDYAVCVNPGGSFLDQNSGQFTRVKPTIIQFNNYLYDANPEEAAFLSELAARDPHVIPDPMAALHRPSVPVADGPRQAGGPAPQITDAGLEPARL